MKNGHLNLQFNCLVQSPFTLNLKYFFLRLLTFVTFATCTQLYIISSIINFYICNNFRLIIDILLTKIFPIFVFHGICLVLQQLRRNSPEIILELLVQCLIINQLPYLFVISLFVPEI